MRPSSAAWSVTAPIVWFAEQPARHFFKNLRTQDPALNHDLERATREAYLLATLELIRQAELRTSVVTSASRLRTAGDTESLGMLRRAVERDLRDSGKTASRPLADAHLFLIDPELAPSVRLTRLRLTLTANLREDLDRWLPDGRGQP
ncbi:MAG: hypothetical protein KIT09_04595 [Bryobacteraceae bacterium]|nr:hypothetical protein [Bryobacteraceae bacterium]